MDVVPSLEKQPLDGRTARARRTREAVVDALLALIEEGDLRPTAPRIAERAGVSLRSIFQHFSDLEALFAAVAARELERIRRHAVPVAPDLPFAERVGEFVRRRARILEFMTPVRRAALLQEPFSAELQAARDRAHALARVEVERVFASELGEVPAGERKGLVAAVETVAGWPAWESLRTASGLSEDAAARVVARTITALLSTHGHPYH